MERRIEKYASQLLEKIKHTFRAQRVRLSVDKPRYVKSWDFARSGLKLSADVYIGLGANLGNPLTTFKKCLPVIEEHSQIISRSINHSAPLWICGSTPLY